MRLLKDSIKRFYCSSQRSRYGPSHCNNLQIRITDISCTPYGTAVTYAPACTMATAVVANPTGGTASTGTNTPSPSAFVGAIPSAVVIAPPVSTSVIFPASATNAQASSNNHILQAHAAHQQHAVMYQHIPYEHQYHAVHAVQQAQWTALQRSVTNVGILTFF